jgi:hypothetical protein
VQKRPKGPGRDGALKTYWTKPWHRGASYGDRMAPAKTMLTDPRDLMMRAIGQRLFQGVRAQCFRARPDAPSVRRCVADDRANSGRSL